MFQKLKRSSKAFLASLVRGVVVSRSTVVLAVNSVQPFRAFLGVTRSGIACMHSNRLPGSNDVHWAQAWRSMPQRVQRELNPISSAAKWPHWAQRTTWRNPGMLMLFGASCEIRRVPAGAPGSGAGRLGEGRGARSRSSSW